MRDELRRVVHEFADGAGRLARTPRALGPIVSITLDQLGQGIVLVLSLFVFRDRFDQGVASFSNLIGAGCCPPPSGDAPGPRSCCTSAARSPSFIGVSRTSTRSTPSRG